MNCNNNCFQGNKVTYTSNWNVLFTWIASLNYCGRTIFQWTSATNPVFALTHSTEARNKSNWIRTSENYNLFSKFDFQPSTEVGEKKLKQRLHIIRNTAWNIYTCACNHKLTLKCNFFPVLISIDIYIFFKCISFYYLHFRIGKIASTIHFLL